MSHTPLKNISISGAVAQKEQEPLATSPLATESLKTVDSSEIKLSPEVQQYITNQDEEQKMKKTEVLKQVGAEVVGDDNGLQNAIGPLLALSDAKIEEGLKQPVNSSFRWLAEFMQYALRQAGFAFKKVNGHLKRVVAPMK